MQGIFITFEGPDGAGKTTQLNRLVERLKQEGHDVLVTREPGGTAIGDQIRALLLSPEHTEMTDAAEVLLYAASRAQHVRQVIRPALERNQIVICDRYIDASIAYQAYGLGVSLESVTSVNAFASGGLQPQRTYLLDIPVEQGRKRLLDRSAQSGVEPLDRIEAKGAAYHERVRNGFLQIAAVDQQRVMIIDADQEEDRLAAMIYADMMKQLAL